MPLPRKFKLAADGGGKFRLGSMSDIAAFKDGWNNGRNFPNGFTQSLYDNIKRFNLGTKPAFRPYISIQHKDYPQLQDGRFGEITGATMKGGILHLDAERIPEEIADLIESGFVREPSIEFIEPLRDKTGRPVSGYQDENGQIVDGPVLKCLTFLGNDIPGVKHLPPLPPVKFHFTGGKVSRFRGFTMDRAAMLQFLQEWGVDVSGITDATPDEVLQAFVAAIQAKNANPAANNPAPPDPNANLNQMADQLLAGLGTGAGTGTGTGAGSLPGNLPQPQQLVMKFNQILGGIVTRANAAIATVESRAKATENRLSAQLTRNKEKAVNEFLDRMGKAGKVPPKMRDGVKKQLMKCDDGTVSKFAHAPAKTGSELDELFDFIEETYPVQREFADGGGARKLPLPGAKEPPKNPKAATGGGGTLTTERRAAILGGSPVGQTLLKKAAAANNN